MILPIDFYDEDPFRKEAIFRVAGAAAMDKDNLYALFLKNFIAFVDQYTNCTDCIDKQYGILFEFEIDQPFLFKNYLNGFLQIKYEFPDCSSHVYTFCEHELVDVYPIEPKDCQSYLSFIITNTDVFKRIDALVNTKYDTKAGISLSAYLSTYGLKLPHSNVNQLGFQLDHYFIAVCRGLLHSYIQQLDESLFMENTYDSYLKDIFLAMNYDLLDEDEQTQLVKLSTRWLTQRFKSFAFVHHMQYAIGETSGAFLFQPFIIRFVQYFSLGTTIPEEKSYPTTIFSSWEAYHLFDSIAQGLSIKVSVSYVYRLLEEKGHIIVKDVPFRNWYNTQGYPLQLSSATETLLNSKSADREQFVGIVAKLLGVTL